MRGHFAGSGLITVAAGAVTVAAGGLILPPGASAAGRAAPTGPPYTPAATASFGGQVWNDADADGVIGDPILEPGVAGATVEVEGYSFGPDGADDGGHGDDRPVTRTLTTDATGRYAATGLDAGRYEARVPAQPQLNLLFATYDLDNGTVDADGDSGPFVLAAGARRTDVNFGYVVTGLGGLAFLEVTTAVTPASDPGRFNLLIDGAVAGSAVGDGGTTNPQVVPPGPHLVSQRAADAATDAARYQTSLSCQNQGTGLPVAVSGGGSSGSLTVAVNDVVMCTFTNRRLPDPTTTTTTTTTPAGLPRAESTTTATTAPTAPEAAPVAATTTTTTSTPAADDLGTESAVAGAEVGDVLPVTGTRTAPAAALGAGLIAAGFALRRRARRRATASR